MKTQFIVQRWSQYKLGDSPLKHDEDADETFDTEEEAHIYAQTADSGFWGDTRYRYEIVVKEN